MLTQQQRQDAPFYLFAASVSTSVFKYRANNDRRINIFAPFLEERIEAHCACTKSGSDRVCSKSDDRDRMGSDMDLGAMEYGRMEIGLIWTSARVGIVYRVVVELRSG